MNIGILSPREREIFDDLIAGRHLKQIAGARNISLRTVENHTENLYKKLKLRNRIDLMATVIREQAVMLEAAQKTS